MCGAEFTNVLAVNSGVDLHDILPLFRVPPWTLAFRAYRNS
jgi:hypothetical protein